MNIENQKESLSLKERIELIINKSKKEQKKVKLEIDKNEDKIWWYKVTNKFDRFLKPSEKWFAIVLSEAIAWPDDLDVSIIVKYENWKITIRDTQQEPFSDNEYNEIQLTKDEQIEWNDDVNKINKLIDSRWFPTIKGEELYKLAKKIESIKK